MFIKSRCNGLNKLKDYNTFTTFSQCKKKKVINNYTYVKP